MVYDNVAYWRLQLQSACASSLGYFLDYAHAPYFHRQGRRGKGDIIHSDTVTNNTGMEMASEIKIVNATQTWGNLLKRSNMPQLRRKKKLYKAQLNYKSDWEK